MAFTSKPSGMSDAAWEIYQKKTAVPTVKDSNKPSVERSKVHVVGDDPFQASLNAFAETKKPRGISDDAWEVYKSANAEKIYSEWQSSMSKEDLEKLSLLKKGDSVTSTGKAPYNFGAGKVNYGEKAAELKQTIKNNMLAGTFGETKPKNEDFSGPKDTSRSLVEQYAYYELKALEDSLKSGSNEIIPIGENISKFFDENGKNFAELYPDLANQYSTDNLTAYAYQTIPEYKKQVDEEYKNSLIEREKDLLRKINFADTLRSENTNAFERPLKEAEAYLFDFGDYVFGRSDTATGKRVANIDREDRVINESLQELADIRAVLSDEYGIEFEDDIKDLPQPSGGYKGKLFNDWFMANGVVGLGNVFSGIASTVDFITPDAIFGEDNVFSETNQYWKDELAKRNENAYKAAERLGGGTGWHLGGEAVAAVTQALPDMLMMAMSGGASEGAKMLPTVSKWGAAKSTSAIAKESVEAIAKDPAFWSSYIQTLGPSYEQALERGATPQEAAFTAIISSTFNSAIETGGVQKLPKTLDTGNSKAVLEFVKSTLDEGKEEVLQSITSDIVSKFIYDKDAPIFSTTDTNAIIDPSLIKDFGMGVTVGGILGAPVAGASFIETRTQVESAGKYINQNNLVNDLIKEGLNAPKGSELYKFAAKLSSKNNISNYDAGKLFVLATENNNSDTFYKDLDNAEKATSNIKSNQGVPASSIIAEKLGYKGGAYAGIQSLIKDNEATSYITDKMLEIDSSLSRADVYAAIDNFKKQSFIESLNNSSMTDAEKIRSLELYNLKEQALERMYRLGAEGLKFDTSLGAGIISDADAFRAFTRGENARMLSQGQSEVIGSLEGDIDSIIEKVSDTSENVSTGTVPEAKVSEDFSKAPKAPLEKQDTKAFGDVVYEGGASQAEVIPKAEKAYSDKDSKAIIDGMGSYGVSIYNTITSGIDKGGKGTKDTISSYMSAIAYVYEQGKSGSEVKRSKAQPLKLKEINAVYDAGKKDAVSSTTNTRKADAKLIKDDSFKNAKVSKRSERILSSMAKITGRDIRFSDDLEGNAKIDFEKGEIIISTKAASGTTWAMVHEVFHAIRKDTPAEANKLIHTVVSILSKNEKAWEKYKGKYVSAYYNEIIDSEGNFLPNAGDIIEEEIAADMIGYVLSDADILENITGQQRNVLQRFVDRLISYFSDGEIKVMNPNLRDAYFEVQREAKNIAKQFKEALEKSSMTERGNALTKTESKVETKAEVKAEAKPKEVIKSKSNQDIDFESNTIEEFDSEAFSENHKRPAPDDAFDANELYAFDNDDVNYEIALEMDQGTESYLIASEMKERLDKGKKVTKSQKANLKESLFWDGPEITLGEIYDFGDVQETKKTSGEEVKMSRDLSKEDAETVRKSTIEYIRSLGRISLNDLTSDNIKQLEKFAKRYKKMGVKSPFFRAWFGDWRANDNTKISYVEVNSDFIERSDIPTGDFYNSDTEWTIKTNYVVKDETTSKKNKWSEDFRSLKDAEQLLSNAILLDTVTISNPSKRMGESAVFVHHLYCPVKIKGTAQKGVAKLYVTETYEGAKRFYLNKIEMSPDTMGAAVTNGAPWSNSSASDDAVSVSQIFDFVKKHDADYEKDSKHPVYFNPKPSSLVVDKDGKPKKVYHSTSEKFDTFDITKSRSWEGVPDYDLPGFYFAENYDTSAAYGDIVGEYYIKITKPYEGSLYDLKREHGTYRAAYDYLVSQGYDGVIVDEFGEGDYEYIVLKDVNIKSATDNIGTFDGDNANTKMSKDLSGEEVIRSDDEIKVNKGELRAQMRDMALKRWGADIGGIGGAPSMSIEETIKKVEKSFGIKVTSGSDASVTGKKVSSYNLSTGTIRTKFKNDLPTIVHALGYHIDSSLKIVDSVIEQTDIVRQENGDGIGEYELELSAFVTDDKLDSRTKVTEGFAEFIRTYFSSKAIALEKAPMFYSYFEDQLKKDEKLMEAVQTSAEAVGAYFAQGISGKAGASVMTSKDWKKLNDPKGLEKLDGWRKALIKTTVDSVYGIKTTEKQHDVFDLTTSKNAYVRATLTRSARSRAAKLLTDGFFDKDGHKVGEALFDIIAPLGNGKSKKFDDFGNYLTFVHAIEWLRPNDLKGKKTSSGKDIYNAKAKGHVFSDESLNDVDELRRLISDYELKYPEFKSIAKKIYEYQDNLMEYYLVPSGALSQDQAETFRAQYPHYVPLNRFNSIYGGVSGGNQRSLFANLRNPVQKADGGNAPIRNPIESIMNSTYKAIDFYSKNSTMLAIIAEFTGSGSIPGAMERVYSSAQLKKLEEQGKNPFMSEEGLIIDESKDTAFTPVIDKEKGIVYAWVNGEKHFYQVYARDLFEAVSNLEVEELKKVGKLINDVSNAMKRTMTMYNPVFTGGNAIRDFFTFQNNTVSNAEGLAALAMYAGSLKSILTGDEYFNRYKALGGMDSTRLSADLDSIERAVNKRNIKDASLGELWKASKYDFIRKLNIFERIVDGFFAFNDVIETLPRLAEFKYSMKSEESKGDAELAFFRAQDVTTNFSRTGTQGRKINAIFLFSNAAMQGIDKSFRVYTEAKYVRKDKSGKHTYKNLGYKVLSNVTVALFMTALMEAINRRDEESEEEYRRLSEFTKNNYYVFHTSGGSFIKIPKEQNIALPKSVLQRIFDATRGDKLNFVEFGDYIWGSFFPDFIPDASKLFTLDIGAGAHQILNNTPFGVVTDVAFNKDYKGSDIVPTYLTGPEYLKYNDQTSAFSVKFAKTLFETTGIDRSPMAIDHYFSAIGWYGTFAVKMFPEESDKSALQRFWDAFGLGRKYVADSRYSSDLLNDFYEGRDNASKRLTAFDTGENRAANEKYQLLGSFISDFNKQSKTGTPEQQRLDREMLQMILEGFDEGDFSEGQKYAARLYEATKNGDVFMKSYPSPELRETKTKKGKKTTTTAILGANEYAEFCADIDEAVEATRILIKNLGLGDAEAAEFLAKEYQNIKSDIKAKYLEKYGVSEQSRVEKQKNSFNEKDYRKEFDAMIDNIIFGD